MPESAGYHYTMPMPKTARVKAEILAHHEDRRPAVAPFTIHGSNGETAGTTMVTVRREKYEEDGDMTDRHLVSAASRAYGSSEEMVEELPEKYRRR